MINFAGIPFARNPAFPNVFFRYENNKLNGDFYQVVECEL
jgi:hypothetical protein